MHLSSSVRFISFALISGAAGWVILAFYSNWAALRLLREDSVVEWSQFALVVLAAWLCWALARGHRKYYSGGAAKKGFALMSMLLLVVAAEEISWGQRIFDFDTPGFVESVNVQGELNLHNLSALHRVRHWGLVLFGTIGLSLLSLGKRPPERGHNIWWRRLRPPAHLAVLCAVIAASGLSVEVTEWMRISGTETGISARFWAGRFSEIAELMGAVAISVYAWIKYGEMRSGAWQLTRAGSGHR